MMNSRLRLAIHRPLPRQTGLSLVELMIAVAIGMFLLLGLSTLLVANSQTSQELNKTGNQIENGRYAMQLLTDDIHLAGFLGTYDPVGATRFIPDPCALTVVDQGFNNTQVPAVAANVTVPVAIHGYLGTAALPTSCATAITNRLAGTAVLIVRRVSTTPLTVAAANAASQRDVYIQVSTCPNALIDAVPFVIAPDTPGTNFPLGKNDCLTTNLAPVRKYMVHIYYVSSCSDCVANDGIPTLKLVELINGSLTSTPPSPLVEGIENMQLDYGIDMDGDGAVDCYTSNPTSPPASEVDPATAPLTACPQTTPSAYVWTNPTANWSNVMAVRINLLARNLEPTANWKDIRTYDMGLTGATAAANDTYKRHAYSAVARLYNISGQREK